MRLLLLGVAADRGRPTANTAATAAAVAIAVIAAAAVTAARVNAASSEGDTTRPAVRAPPRPLMMLRQKSRRTTERSVVAEAAVAMSGGEIAVARDQLPPPP
jgi:hypothetical protein